MAVLPIENQEGLALYKNELEAVARVGGLLELELATLEVEIEEQKNFSTEDELSKKIDRINQLKMYSLLKDSVCINLIKDQIEAFNEREAQKNSQWVEKNVVTPVMREGWTVMLGLGQILKEAIALTAAVLEKILFPVNFVIDGLRSIWDFYNAWRDKTLGQRKTTLTATAFNIAGLVAALIVLGLAVANPFALPGIVTALMFMGIYKESYALHQTRSLIKEETANIQSLETKREVLMSQEDTPLKSAQLVSLNAQIERHLYQLKNLQEKRFQAARQVAFNTVSAIGVVLLIGGVFFPPLAAAGLLVFAGAALANVLDNKFNCYFTRKIASIFNGSKTDLASVKSELAPLLGQDKQPEPLPTSLIYDSLGHDEIPLAHQKQQNVSSLKYITGGHKIDAVFEEMRLKNGVAKNDASTVAPPPSEDTLKLKKD